MGDPLKRRCCCRCDDGELLIRRKNTTKVVPAGGSECDADPFPRYVEFQYDIENYPEQCSSLPPGSCGKWIENGDLSGTPSEDICGCQNVDHNCYTQDGTVDMRHRRLGGQWVHAQKSWHGAFGFIDNDGCEKNPNIAPSQTKFLKFEITGSFNSHFENWNGGPSGDNSGEYTASNEVGRLTGIRSNQISISQNASIDYTSVGLYVLETVENLNGTGFYVDPNTEVRTDVDKDMLFVFAGDIRLEVIPTHNIEDFRCNNEGTGRIATIWADGGVTYRYLDSDGSPVDVFWPVVGDKDNWSVDSGDAIDCYRWDYNSSSWVVAGQATFNATFSRTNTVASYSITYQLVDYFNYSLNSFECEVTATLSGEYSSGQCLEDLYGLMSQWDMSDMNLAKLREDEQLANAPLCLYDEEVGAVPPSIVWTGWSEVVQPSRSGDKISHTPPGSDRHFWFGYVEWVRRQYTMGVCEGSYYWYQVTYGELSKAPLPEVSMRWLSKFDSQYDPGQCCPNGCPYHIATLPQSWLWQQGGILRGGKYIEATRRWPSVNYGMPCGWRKYEITQKTVCCIVSGNAESGFVVKPTGNADAPLGGGLAINDYVAVESDGIYKITGITDIGSGQYTVTVDTKIDDLPTGFKMVNPLYADAIYKDSAEHMGKLRWPSSVSGILGRAPITTSYDSATSKITITPGEALPYLRKNPATGEIPVDLYDEAMTNKIQATLQRVSDTEFWFTHTEAIPNHVWMTGRDYDWELFDETTKRTGVKLEWTFDNRSADENCEDPPDWYGGITGCLDCSIQEFTYDDSRCPAFVGIVPFYSGNPVENFDSKVKHSMFSMPGSFEFDDVYGAIWMGAVETVMPDPFDEGNDPYKPDCDLNSETESMTWTIDSGCGQEDRSDELPGGTTHHTRYYPHCRWVEAKSTIPSGKSLPASVELFYSPGSIIAPPYYPLGIPIGDVDGNYRSIERPFGFVLRVCENTCTDPNRFKDFYREFTKCP